MTVQNSERPTVLRTYKLMPTARAISDILPSFYEVWKGAFSAPDRLPVSATRERHSGAATPDQKIFVDFIPGMCLPPLVSRSTAALFEHLVDVAEEAVRSLEREVRLPSNVSLVDVNGPHVQAVMRITRYPSSTRAAVIGHAHKDIDLLTLLPPPSAEGLEICHCGVWHPVAIPDGSVLVLPGEVLERLGGPPAAVHRVVSPGRERISVSFFLNALPGIVLTSGETVGNAMRARIQEIRA